jgi:GT2 family glycosyltransferase
MLGSRAVPVSVVVVNWNAGPALAACLASLDDDAGRGAEVIVVDNASTDGSTASAVAGRPRVRVLELPANVGFARGANAGASAATGDPIVFLNPDAQVEAGAIVRLADALCASPGSGIAGGGLVDERGRWQPGAARFGVVRHLVLDTTLGRLPARRRHDPYRVDWVYGTFMAVRREVLVALGGFDPGYFIYGEDLDLCHRAATRGWTTLHVPAARAVHGRNVSATGRFGLGRDAAVVAGELRFFARRGRPGAANLYRLLAGAKFGAKALVAAVTGRPLVARRAARVVWTCVRPGEALAA